jgi:hypothetical protein
MVMKDTEIQYIEERVDALEFKLGEDKWETLTTAFYRQVSRMPAKRNWNTVLELLNIYEDEIDNYLGFCRAVPLGGAKWIANTLLSRGVDFKVEHVDNDAVRIEVSLHEKETLEHQIELFNMLGKL